MFNNFFTPQQISPLKRQNFDLHFTDKYDFSSLLQKDLFQIVSPYVESISDQKRKIIAWLKKVPLIQRMHILTYTNKQFVCLIRTMYQKKQQQYQENSSIAFTISHIEQTDEFDLMTMTNNKKLNPQFINAQDNLLDNIKIMSRYTPFDSITFSDNLLRNIDIIFHLFDILGDGISHQLTSQDYERLRKLPNYVMFYDRFQQHGYKKATIGTWITQTLIKDISMKYIQFQLKKQSIQQNQLKQNFKQIQKYWKIFPSQKKNQIIKKVLQQKPIQLYQQHRQITKVTRNGFPSILLSDKIPNLLKSIMNANQKQIIQLLYYNGLNETIYSHSILKYYIKLQIEDQIRKHNDQQKKAVEENKMKKKKKKNSTNTNNNNHNKLIAGKVQSEKNCKNIAQTTNISNKQAYKVNQIVKKEEIKQRLITIANKNEVIVKGTDLFYKKLEISQTQQIICIHSTYEQPKIQQNTQQADNCLKVDLQQKQKPKKKNKKKKKKNNPNNNNQTQQTQQNIREEKKNQIHNKILEKQLINKKMSQKSYERKSSISKSANNDKISQKSSQTTNDQLQQQNQISKIKQGLKEKEFCQDQKSNIKSHNQSQLIDPLSSLMKQLNKQINFFNKQRKLINNRLSYVFAQHDLSFKLYGSTLCQVALPFSDIDIVVDPSIVNYFYFSYSNYKKKIINSLQYIQKMFQKFQWADDFILLPGANIPLLTFTVNPNIEFQLEAGNTHQYNNKKQLKEDIKISVDVTIEPYINMTDEVPMHLGVQSTQLIKQWVNLYPFYRQMLILLKLFIKNKGLNKLYHGGISSFIQSIILAGFYKHFFINLMNESWNDFQNKKQIFQEIMPADCNLTRIFTEYCEFIIKFQEDKSVIDLNSVQSIVYKPDSIPKQVLAIMNPLTGKLMSQRCTVFKEYRKMIQQIYQTLIEENNDLLKQELGFIFQI